ncbi:hypothetical protein WAE61_00430 [Comamonadaceae bacterium PP-2]
MNWRKLNEDERWQFRQGKEPPPGRAWLTSPCLVLVEINEHGDEASLLERLDDAHFEDAIVGLDPDPCMLADFYCAHGMLGQLVSVLERSLAATAYVLDIPEREDTGGQDWGEGLRRAHDLARSIAGRRAAIDAVNTLI